MDRLRLNAFGTSHGVLLDDSTILAELGSKDLECLEEAYGANVLAERT